MFKISGIFDLGCDKIRLVFLRNNYKEALRYYKKLEIRIRDIEESILRTGLYMSDKYMSDKGERILLPTQAIFMEESDYIDFCDKCQKYYIKWGLMHNQKKDDEDPFIEASLALMDTERKLIYFVLQNIKDEISAEIKTELSKGNDKVKKILIDEILNYDCGFADIA